MCSILLAGEHVQNETPTFATVTMLDLLLYLNWLPIYAAGQRSLPSSLSLYYLLEMGDYWSVLIQTFPPSPEWTVNDIPDLSGKVVVVTGKNIPSGYVSMGRRASELACPQSDLWLGFLLFKMNFSGSLTHHLAVQAGIQG